MYFSFGFPFELRYLEFIQPDRLIVVVENLEMFCQYFHMLIVLSKLFSGRIFQYYVVESVKIFVRSISFGGEKSTSKMGCGWR